MTDLLLAIITKLKADTAVTAVVGTKIYRRGSVPTNPTAPYIIVSRVDNLRDTDTNTGRYAHARLQCSAFASTDSVVANVSELIANSLHRTANTYLVAGTEGVYVISVRDAGSTPDENTDIPLYMEHRDFMIHYDYR